MKKVLFFLLALAVAFSLSAPAMAKDGLSFGVGLGTKFDPNGLADTIMKDGLERTGSNNDVLIPENTLTVMKHYHVIRDLNLNGSMMTLDLAANVRYDFLNALFIRLGINTCNVVAGGETSWKFTQLAAASVVMAGGALDTGGTMVQKWDYNSTAIPLTFGVNLPVADGKYNFYAGLGVTWARAWWSIEITAPFGGYAVAAQGAYAEAAAIYGPAAGLAVQRVNERLTFRSKGSLGLNFLVGADANIGGPLSLFVEFENQYVAKMTRGVAVKSHQAVMLLNTATIAYPVVPGGQVLRLGLKYAI